MNIAWLMRMRRWVQNPPSASRVKFVFAVVLAGAFDLWRGNTLATGPNGPQPNASRNPSDFSKWQKIPGSLRGSAPHYRV